MTLEEFADKRFGDTLTAMEHQFVRMLCRALHKEGFSIVKLEPAKGFEPTGGPGTPHYVVDELT